MNHPALPSIFRPVLTPSGISLPLFTESVPAGFPSPADDYLDGRLSLDEHLIPNKDSTFLVRASGNSMVGAGIFDGDLMVVDKGLDAKIGDIVVAVVDGEFTVKYLAEREGRIYLKPANHLFRDITLGEGQELSIWGVVTSTIKQFRS